MNSSDIDALLGPSGAMDHIASKQQQEPFTDGSACAQIVDSEGNLMLVTTEQLLEAGIDLNNIDDVDVDALLNLVAQNTVAPRNDVFAKRPAPAHCSSPPAAKRAAPDDHAASLNTPEVVRPHPFPQVPSCRDVYLVPFNFILHIVFCHNFSKLTLRHPTLLKLTPKPSRGCSTPVR